MCVSTVSGLRLSPTAMAFIVPPRAIRRSICISALVNVPKAAALPAMLTGSTASRSA